MLGMWMNFEGVTRMRSGVFKAVNTWAQQSRQRQSSTTSIRSQRQVNADRNKLARLRVERVKNRRSAVLMWSIGQNEMLMQKMAS